MPPAVLVDEEGLIRHLHGEVAPFLRPPTGAASDALAARLRPDLEPVVATLLARAGEASLVHRDDAGRTLRIRAIPAPHVRGWTLLVFDAREPPALDAEVTASLAGLEDDLTEARRERDRLLGERRALERELAAAREEAAAATQELETTTAELEANRILAQRRGEALAATRTDLEGRLAELRQQTSDLDNLLRGTDVAIVFLDAAGTVRWFTPAVTAVLPLTAADVGRPLGDLTHRLANVEPLVDAAQVRARAAAARREVATSDGRWFVMQTRPYRTPQEGVDGLVLTFAEVTDLKHAQLALDEQRELATHIVDTLREPLVVLDRELRIQSVNDAFRRQFARSDTETVGTSLFDLDQGLWDAATLRGLLEDVLPRERGFEGFVIEHEFPNLGRRTLELNARHIDHLDRILLAMEDVTEARAAQAQIERLALRDALTGLPNRALLQDRLHQAFATAGRNGTRAALMLLDLDGFKDVNDTLGHPAGDLVLREVARRLGERIRADDTLARLGGDEFAVVLPDLADVATLDPMAHRLMGAFAEPFALDGHEARLSVSTGIALFPDDGEDATTLMRHADLALYRAKAAGRRQFRFFEPEMNAQAQRRRVVERDLRRAVEAGGFALAFQPQFALADGALTAIEALLRWHHPTNGAVPPDDFIPIAEACGLIRPIGAWVLDAACRELGRWRGLGFAGRIAVNLSPVQLRDTRLVATIDAALERHGLGGGDLELEITETLLADPDVPAVAAFLDAVAARGIGLAVDDFGKGYSALGYLQRLPVQKIKIDRDFLWRATDDDKARALFAAMVTLGRTLDKTVVAEGVETRAQLDLLRRVGCTEAQGFYLAAPSAPDALDRWFRRRHP
jgi:two-component system CheB/CheR fusion protein